MQNIRENSRGNSRAKKGRQGMLRPTAFSLKWDYS